MEYLDFELEIEPGRGLNYPVAVVRSPAGEARETMVFPFTKLQLDTRLQGLENVLIRSTGTRRRIPSSQERPVQEFGNALFRALMTGSLLSRYEQSLQEARVQGKGLRLKLRIQDSELAALPWEFLYDRDRGYVALSRNTPIVRYLDIGRPVEPLAVVPPLRILGMVANPHHPDLDELDVTYEKQRVEAAIDELRATGQIELTWLSGQSWRDLQQVMRAGPWHVFHFIGHGGFDEAREEGIITLADDRGKLQRLQATQLAPLLSDHYPLRLVLLNACEGARSATGDIFSSTAAILVQRGIPAVLAMQYEISDYAAIEFARSFYDGLASNLPVDTAVAEARQAVNLTGDNSLEWGTPVLYMRAPDGHIFDIEAAPDLGVAEPTLSPRRMPPERATEVIEEADERQHLIEQYAAGKRAHEGGDWTEAITRLEAVMTLDSGYLDASALLEDARRQDELARLSTDARRLHTANEWQQVVDIFARIKELDPSYMDRDGLLKSAQEQLRTQQEQEARQRELAALYAEAQDALRVGNWEVAVERLEAVVRIDPNLHSAVVLLEGARRQHALQQALREQEARQRELAERYDQGRQALETQFWAQAIDHFEAVAALDEGYLDVITLLDEARENLLKQQAEEARPGRLAAWYTEVQTSKANGQWGAALSLLRGILADAPEYRDAAAQLAEVELVLRLGAGIHPENVDRLEVQHELGGYRKQVNSVAFSPDGECLACGSGGLWKDQLGVRLRRVTDGGSLWASAADTLPTVWAVAFNLDGQLLASGTDDNWVRQWQVADGELLRILTGHSGSVRSVAFSPDGQLLASGSNDQTVRLWRVADGKHLRTFADHSGSVSSVAFSPNGQLLASGSNDGTVRLWRVADGEPLRTLTGHTWYASSVAFSPDGQLLASGSNDQTVRLWQVADGELLHTLTGHTGAVMSVAFSPDGQLLASGSYDQSMRLWQVADGKLLRALFAATGHVNSVAFSLDGQLLATGSDAQKVRLWRLRDE